MTNITEIIPDDLPEWAIKAMAEGQLFNVMSSRIKKLEAGLNELWFMAEESPTVRYKIEELRDN